MPIKRKLQIRIVFDTNAIINTQSESELLNKSTTDLIKSEAKRNDIELSWHLPEIVVKERQHQMQEAAKVLLPTIRKLEKLLGHKLNITDEILKQRVSECIAQTIKEYKLTVLQIDKLRVDWGKIIEQSCYRSPPFSAGEKEKGFKDAMIAESFFQFVESSPKSSKNIKIIFVTDDVYLSQYIIDNTKKYNIVHVSTKNDLEGLINTFASDIDTATIKTYQQLAGEYFFIKENKGCLYFKGNIRADIINKYEAQLSSCQKMENSVRKNGTWRIYPPQFMKKERTRVMWSSKIEVSFEIYQTRSYPISSLAKWPMPTLNFDYGKILGTALQSSSSLPVITNISDLENYTPALLSYLKQSTPTTVNASSDENLQKKIICTGKSVFEVIWDVNIGLNKRLTRAKIKEIKYVDTCLDNA